MVLHYALFVVKQFEFLANLMCVSECEVVNKDTGDSCLVRSGFFSECICQLVLQKKEMLSHSPNHF